MTQPLPLYSTCKYNKTRPCESDLNANADATLQNLTMPQIWIQMHDAWRPVLIHSSQGEVHRFK